METITRYLKALSKLNRGVTKYGKAPHKIILLLTVLQAFRNNLILKNEIYVSPELVAIFKINWNKLVLTDHVCNFALPFWHLKGEGFWHLIPKRGFEAAFHLKKSVSSLGELNSAVLFAKLDNELFELMRNEKNNSIMQQFLLDTYFPGNKIDFNDSRVGQQNLFDEIEAKILHEDPEVYGKEIEILLSEKNEEEIYIRGSIFKREISKIYNNTCCISGMKVDATINVSMVDACHIIQWTESHDDTITNGIALCPNLHRAFDRGLIAIDSNYKVVVSSVFREDESIYSIRNFEGKQILLPKQSEYFPLKKNFESHMKNVYKA